VTPRGRAWLAVGIWAAFQLTLTSIPGTDLPSLPVDWFDKVAHAGLYFGLGFLVARVGRLDGWRTRTWLVAWAAIVASGALDELHQLLVPARDAEWLDWVCDSIGSAGGLVAGWTFWRRRVTAWRG